MGLHIGFDVGSTSTNSVVIDGDNQIIFKSGNKRHSGKIIESVKAALRKIHGHYKEKQIESVSFTGINGRTLADRLHAPFYWDILAQKEGVLALNPDVKSIISIGGQNSYLLLVENNELAGYATNSDCAAGTGSFLEVQALRLFESEIREQGITEPAEMLDYAIKRFVELGLKSKNAASVASKCTVFAKTDITHLANDNTPKPDIVAGLAKGLKNTYITDIIGNRTIPKGDAVLVGGCSLNPLLLKFFQENIPGLRVPEYSTLLQAYGAALLSKKEESRNEVSLPSLDSLVLDAKIERTSRLKIEKSVLPIDNNTGFSFSSYPIDVYLGIDIGSTTTKSAIIDRNGKLVHKEYIKTEGDPIGAVKKLLITIRNKYQGKLNIKGVGTTGSGRMVTGYFVGADCIINEITAHAKAAVAYNPEVDTVFEIGGQDSKYISIRDGNPVDDNMNKICSAGTGSFLEELAEKLGIDIIGEFEKLALKAKKPIYTSDRCTVFMESDISAALQKGATTEDVCAGAAIAVIHNYINRVVESRPIGDNIMFLGGPSNNKAVVAALEKITGSSITVPEHSEVFGAEGIALCTKERMEEQGITETSFRGFDVIDKKLDYKEIPCRRCPNECTLRQYTIPSKGLSQKDLKVISGGICGRFETGPPGVKKADNFFDARKELFEQMIMTNGDNTSGKKVVLPRQLYMNSSYGVLWPHLFNSLGAEVVWGPETNEKIIDIGTRNTPSNLCFSKTVSIGHIGYTLGSLVKGDGSFLFLPSMINMETPREEEPGMYCPIIQGSFFTSQGMYSLKGRDDVLSPSVDFKKSPEDMAYELHQGIGRKLGVKEYEIKNALKLGLGKKKEFDERLLEFWNDTLYKKIRDDIAIVVVGRPYLLHDPRLNLNIGSEISKLGILVIPMDYLPLGDIDISEYDNMYWGLGAEIIRATKFIKENPNLFGVYLTNFNCGSDSFILKYAEEEMRGKDTKDRKPYSVIELDAHTARAGVITRLEAFIDVIKSYYHSYLKSNPVSRGET